MLAGDPGQEAEWQAGSAAGTRSCRPEPQQAQGESGPRAELRHTHSQRFTGAPAPWHYGTESKRHVFLSLGIYGVCVWGAPTCM